MNYEGIIYQKRDGIATITLNRPDKLNAINFQVIDEMLEAISDTAVDDKARVMVIKGAGRAFSAGDDLKGMGESSRKIGKDMVSYQIEGHPRFVKAIRGLMKPVIASVHGYALGAACELVLACDLVIAAEDARLGLPYVQRGIGSGTYTVPLSVGYRKACELLFLGDWISGKEAERIGMINRAVPADQLDAAVKELAGRLAKGATVAIAQMKRAMNQGPLADFEAGMALQTLAQMSILDTEDAREGSQAFIEKREPQFKGR
ncbi:MAG: enoyl-CoA hydratase/isomerase family protein [Dehalococcoidia bacterium]